MNILERLSKSENEIIQEIHDSFDNAQDELLEQANDIISRFNPDYGEKALRLKNLGFTSTREVVNYEGKNKDLVSSKKDADLVNYYKTSYPFLKFLKEEQLDAICKKYNLIYAPVGRYKEEVPVNNLTEIENAQPLKDVDTLPKMIKALSVQFSDQKTNFSRFLKDYPNGLISIEQLKKWHPVISTALHCTYGFHVEKYQEIDKSGLFIAAPKSHFDLKGLKNKELGFFNITITEVKDPIVFRYVKGGIQVLSKWGLEANDPELAVGITN